MATGTTEDKSVKSKQGVSVFRYPGTLDKFGKLDGKTDQAAKTGGLMPSVIFTEFEWEMPGSTKKEAKRTKNGPKSNIALYMPQGFSESAGATWGPEEVFDIGNVKGELLAAGQKMVSANGGKLNASAKAYSGKTVGPTDLFIFQKPNPYTLSFSFSFVPRNKSEGDTVVKMIKYFKTSVLPKYEGERWFSNLKFPNIWDIQFKNIHGPGAGVSDQYEDMALTNVTASYAGGANSALVFYDGNPVECSLQLSFQSIRYAIQE